ncbi:hypothetical protein O181_051065 [Austropuccinia psidii MF-1]|uniref:Uncharacterized protein n=1 Tax=Austropuccinia psidii MF-1 TaxID=1389203 RepID=A0A9Q3DWF8_9BASI|nr:hypothetical protein [Austropuccinia psidii MF-1]
MKNSFEEAIFNIERDRPMSWFLKQKDRLNAVNPDMSKTMVHKRILRKCGGDLEHSIRRRCIEPCSTEDYINAKEDICHRGSYEIKSGLELRNQELTWRVTKE